MAQGSGGGVGGDIMTVTIAKHLFTLLSWHLTFVCHITFVTKYHLLNILIGVL